MLTQTRLMRTVSYSGLNPNPPGDCGLDGLRIAGRFPCVEIRLLILCGGVSIDHFA